MGKSVKPGIVCNRVWNHEFILLIRVRVFGFVPTRHRAVLANELQLPHTHAHLLAQSLDPALHSALVLVCSCLLLRVRCRRGEESGFRGQLRQPSLELNDALKESVLVVERSEEDDFRDVFLGHKVVGVDGELLVTVSVACSRAMQGSATQPW
ncbi:hypothetical protein BC830DRAFT_1159858 [Chytriomyces sp. MP71]|nr:hypothetical protein BC830DRAFT_1159858 [Chytriomyces sp. MP71]